MSSAKHPCCHRCHFHLWHRWDVSIWFRYICDDLPLWCKYNSIKTKVKPERLSHVVKCVHVVHISNVKQKMWLIYERVNNLTRSRDCVSFAVYKGAREQNVCAAISLLLGAVAALAYLVLHRFHFLHWGFAGLTGSWSAKLDVWQVSVDGDRQDATSTVRVLRLDFVWTRPCLEFGSEPFASDDFRLDIRNHHNLFSHNPTERNAFCWIILWR